ncbi:Ger(x)C family spore germination protein [Halalkalibacter akibai]|uniref:Spore germination protein GerKC n=1 Tax=Halalkalibacter akibai (strain ATCC 43226 / DSM 21942 / CIP 109018 / JCM 9157 / 1139) TaxID=1236973 RepID=W4QQB0_HALA3|nr:Ger(x)C family spore germination protein [Halalkalibacter akibai]GAE34266.1 spore germination protein GerKC [Halalkalibacter akibai JCM 9157]
MRKVFFILLAILVLTGCWDRREINELTLVSGLAIEKGEGDFFNLTIEAINASELDPSLSEGLAPTVTFTLTGLTMGELLSKMNLGLTRELNFSHARTLVIDEKLAREDGVSRFLKFLEKSGQFRNDFQIIVSKGVKAKDIITTTYPVQKVPSFKIFRQFETLKDQWGGFPETTLTDFVFSLTSPGRDPMVAAISIEGDPSKGSSVNDNMELDMPAIAVYDGIAVFEKDKLIGYLSVEEARNVMWIKDLETTTTSVPCGENGYYSVRVFNNHSTVDTEYENNKAKIKVKLVIEGEIYDNQCARGLDDINTYEDYQSALKEHLETKLRKTIKKVQEDFKVDIFGFGEKMSKQHYQKFKQINDWNEEFINADVEVEASVYIRRDGMRTKSFLEQVD